MVETEWNFFTSIESMQSCMLSSYYLEIIIANNLAKFLLY